MKTSVTDPVYDVSSAAEHVSLSQGPVTGNLWFTTASLSVYHHIESITFILSSVQFSSVYFCHFNYMYIYIYKYPNYEI